MIELILVNFLKACIDYILTEDPNWYYSHQITTDNWGKTWKMSFNQVIYRPYGI